jgi:hypothetical protein
MKHSFAQQRKARLPIALSFDQFQLGHMPFHHAVAVDVLYAWAQTPRAITVPKQGLVPSESVVTPTRLGPDASLAEWRDFYVRMAAVIEWQMELDEWRGSVESRLEGLEAMTGLIPEILERLGRKRSLLPIKRHCRPTSNSCMRRLANRMPRSTKI